MMLINWICWCSLESIWISYICIKWSLLQQKLLPYDFKLLWRQWQKLNGMSIKKKLWSRILLQIGLSFSSSPPQLLVHHFWSKIVLQPASQICTQAFGEKLDRWHGPWTMKQRATFCIPESFLELRGGLMKKDILCYKALNSFKLT
jgi:hypothetical protein